MDTVTFAFRFSAAYRVLGLPFGVTPRGCRVELDGETLTTRFGPWRVRTPLSNVRSTEVTGPFTLLKAGGPARLSLADRGLTFATNSHRGLCIRFREPVGGIEPTGTVRHPGLTVTVADCAGLARALVAGASSR